MKDIRKSGLDVIGDVPWGAHFCLFYQTKEDLLDILVPYFKVGFENNEFCMWVTSEPLKKEDAIEAMRRAIPDFDQYLRRGQIEIIPHTDWYLKGGYFDQQRVLDGWVEKLNQAILNGFEGLRLTGNALCHEKRDWRTFAEYEEAVNSFIGKCQMMAICTYSLDKCGAREVMDLVGNHHLVLIRSGGEWNVIESLEHKEIRQALQKSEGQFRSAFDHAPIGMALVGLDGRFLRVNQALCNIVGYPEEELLKLTFQEITHPDDLEADLALTAKLFAGEIPSFGIQKRYVHNNGNIVWISLSGSVVTDAHKRIIHGIVQIQDITEQKRTEEVIRQTSQTLQTLFEASPLATITLDTEANVKMWNPAAERLFGWSASEVIGRPNPIIAPEQMQEFRALFKEELKGRSFSGLELRRMKKDGSLVDVSLWTASFRDASGNVTGMIGMFTDITERKLAEEALRMNSRELEESNSALKILLRQRENDRCEIEEKIMDNVKQIVLPYIEMLKKKKREIPEDNTYLNIIESNLKEIVSSFTTSLSHRLANLTPKEMLIANLVKEGKQDKDIAEILHLSIDTIKAHRRNIRKKLNLIGKKTNLRMFLSDLK